MVHHDAAAHASPDAEYLETPPGAQHEHTDANVWIIVKFVVWLTVSAVITSVGLGLMYAFLIERAEEVGEQPYPLAIGGEPRLPPTPRLQQFPRVELYEFRTGEEQLLQSYGWVDRDAGTVRIPISEAMRLLVERGFPARPQDGAQTETPGLMPSDASSGRTMERGRE